MNQQVLVQNVKSDYAVQVSLTTPAAAYEKIAVGLSGCSFTSANLFPETVRMHVWSGPNGTGSIVAQATVDPAVFWQTGVTNETTVFIDISPYVTWQSVAFYFSGFGRNTDFGDIQFSGVVVAEPPVA